MKYSFLTAMLLVAWVASFSPAQVIPHKNETLHKNITKKEPLTAHEVCRIARREHCRGTDHTCLVPRLRSNERNEGRARHTADRIHARLVLNGIRSTEIDQPAGFHNCPAFA